MLLRRLSEDGPLGSLGSARICLSSILVFIAVSGCRTSLRNRNSEPSFDRLIEIEQQSNSRAHGRDTMASSLRPGNVKYPDSLRDESSERTTASNSPQFASARDAELEEMLVDVPPAQRQLLRREMDAMQSLPRGSSEKAAALEAPAGAARDAVARKPSRQHDLPDEKPVSFRMTDDGVEEFADDSDIAELSETPLASREVNASSESKASPIAASESKADTVAVQVSRVRHAPDNSSSSDSVVALAKNTAVAGEVVTASYSEKNRNPSSEELELDWRQHVRQAIVQLEQASQAASPEEKVQLEMVDRLLQLSVGDLNAAMAPVEGLQTHGQEFVRHSLESLYEVTNPKGNPIETKRYTLAMLSQRKALTHLAAVSNLEVRNAAFCTEVDGFGVVSKFPQYHFRADQELLLYCELDNFVSNPVEGKGFETQLQGSYEIVDSSGRRVADQLLPMDSHLCRNQRRDYFIAYRIYMPPSIDPGNYKLKLIVEDVKGRKFGQSSVDFQIVR